jgi:SH3-like domain-containing protein
MKRLVAFLLVLVLTLPLCVSVSLADELDDLSDEDIEALFYLALLDEMMTEAEKSGSSSSSSSSRSKTPYVPASTAPVTAVSPYYANVKTNGGVLNVRNKANKGATILLKLANGSQLLVKGYTGNWLQVEVNGLTGFVPSRYVTGAVQAAPSAASIAQQQIAPTPTTGGYYAIVNPTNNFVNMRATPSMDSQVLAVYYYGQRLRVVSQMGEWCQVVDEATGRNGYMATRFLLVDNSASANNG